ncbi:MAG: TonB-dependent receptor [Lewinellaceae bacterium]|nr:TonB-dependent receptor [Lewinellaceae bacterium]
MKTTPIFQGNWLLLTFSFLLSTTIHAQTTVSGFVHDIASGDLLIGASIQVKGTRTGAVTGQDGSFRFTTSEPLPLTLAVACLGYKTRELVVNADSEYLDILLYAESYTSEEVVITASRWKEKIYDAPAAISTVPTAMLEAQVLSSPMLVLQYTPGVHIEKQGTERNNIGLRIGGRLLANYTQIILDNRTLTFPGLAYFEPSNSALSVLDMDQVEVVRGSATAIYGPGATQGVVNFQSKDPFKYPGTSVEVVGGERATFQTSIRHAWHSKNEKFGYKVNANFRRSNDWKLDPNDPADSTSMAQMHDEIIDPRTGEVVYNTEGSLRKDNLGYGTNATIEFRPAYDLSFSASGGFSRYEGLYWQPFGEALTQSNEYFGMLKARYGNLFAQLSINQSGGFNNDHPSFNYRSGQIASFGRTHWEGQVQYGLHLRPIHTRLILGGDFTLSRMNTQGLIFGRYEDNDNYDFTGGYAQTKTALFDQLDLVLSGRMDYFKTFKEVAFSPGAALLYKINEQNTFRINYNLSRRAPTMIALYPDFPLVNYGAFDVWYLGGREAQTFAEHPSTVSFIPGVGETPGIGMPLQAGYAVVLAALGNALPSELITYLQSEIPNIGGFSQGITDRPLENNEPLGLSNQKNFELGYSGRLTDKLKVLTEFSLRTLKNDDSQAVQIGALVFLPTLPEDLATVVNSTLDPATLANYGLTPAEVAAIFQQAAASFASPTTPLGLVETEQMPEGGLPHLAYGIKNARKINTTVLDIGFQYSIMETLMFHGTYGHAFKSAGGIAPPTDKFILGLYYWQLPALGFRANLNMQYIAKWKVAEGIYAGVIPAHSVVDASIGYQWPNLSLDVTATNILNDKYRFPGLPKIGRQVLARVVYTFGSGV